LLYTTHASDSRPGCLRVKHPPFCSGRLLVEIRVVMMPMMVMVMVVRDHDNLALRSVGNCKAEEEN